MGGDKSKKKGFLFLHRRESEQALVVAGGRSMSGKARVTKRVYLQFTGYDQRLFPYVEHIAWAARQIPTMHVSGPTPLPRKTFRRTVLKVTEHSFHEVDNFYRRSVMSGETAALAKQQQ